MARRASPFRIGLFVLICSSLIVAAILWIELGNRFGRTETFACYFNESVKGLQKDAPAVYRGVPVGRVSQIGLAPDGRLVEVLLEIRSDFRIDLTIAAQLRDQGLTGLRYLEIDKAAENIDQITPKIAFPTKYPIIRTQPSELEQLKYDLTDLYQKFARLDLDALVGSWTKTSGMMNDLLIQLGAGSQPGDLKETVTALRDASQSAATVLERIKNAASEQGINQGFKDLGSTLAATRQASERLAQQIKALPPDVLKTLSQQLSQDLKSGGVVLADIDGKVVESAALFEENLRQLRVLLSELNLFVRNLKEQPNRLIFPSKEQQDPFKRK